MKVVIFCGGLGSRLREETEFRPKPMLEIGDQPILVHIMKIYAHYGFNEFILCLGYKGHIIKEYFYHYEIRNNDFTVKLGEHKSIDVHKKHKEEGWKITLADTGAKALKGARLKHVQSYIDGDNFFMTYGDGLADIDLGRLLEFHKSHGKLVTMTGVRPSSRFGELKLKGEQVESFIEKPQGGQGFINGGFFVVKRKFLDYLTEDERCDLESGALEQLAKQGELMMYPHEGFWACMDTWRDMEHLNKLWQEGTAPWKALS